MEPKCNSRSHQQPKSSKATQMPTTSNAVFFFPPEILSEILSRLPVKSLLRFRCVSKAWCALISSSEFAKLHLKVSAFRKDFAHHKILSSSAEEFPLKQCSLQSVMSEPVTEAFEVDYPMKSRLDYVRIVGSCNGLVCIVIEEKILIIWNPTTRKFKKVLDPGVKLTDELYVVYGFGYDELNDDYKVVGIFCIPSTKSCEAEVRVYSLKSDFWRRIKSLRGGFLLNDSGKYVNGKIHWAVSPSYGSTFGMCNVWEIVSLDLANEMYGKVEQPDFGETEAALDLVLGVVCGYLCILCQHEWAHCDLWVMKEYGVNESWTTIVTIPPLEDPWDIWNRTFSSPFCISKNGEVVLVFGSTTIVVYDPKTEALRYPEITNFGAILEAETYLESLVSPVADGEAGRGQHQYKRQGTKQSRDRTAKRIIR